MKVKTQGVIILLVGILGAVFVSIFDVLVGKPVNDITGPRSIIALIACVLLIIMGIRFLLKKPKL